MSLKKSLMRAMIFAMVAISFATIGWYVRAVLTFHGVSNSETVQIIDTKSNSSHVAMLVERSDQAALSGNTFFVFINDHPYQLPELRRRLYVLQPVFKVGRGSFSLNWIGSDELAIRCENCDVSKELIERQLYAQNGVTVRYVGFP